MSLDLYFTDVPDKVNPVVDSPFENSDHLSILHTAEAHQQRIHINNGLLLSLFFLVLIPQRPIRTVDGFVTSNRSVIVEDFIVFRINRMITISIFHQLVFPFLNSLTLLLNLLR